MDKFENKVKNTITKHRLATKKDRIAVAVSGGKDSTTALYLLKKFGYDVEAIIIDLLIGEYTKKNIENITKFCDKNGIKLTILNIRDEVGYSLCYIRDVLKSKGIKWQSCTICGTLKRYILNKKARELGFTKIATGHNMDDEAQTILMNLLKGTPELNAKLGPTTGIVKDKRLVPRIKPLYFCTEKDIESYSKRMNFPVLYDKCPCSTGVFRRSLRESLETLYKTFPKARENIIKKYLKGSPNLKKRYSSSKIGYCTICNEPARSKICSFCRIMDNLK